jgi:hypothetical protein
MEEASRKTRKVWCPNSDRHDNMEKERDTETSLLNFMERAKHNFSTLQRRDTFASVYECFIWILQIFAMIFKYFLGPIASVSDNYFMCFICLFFNVATVASGCFKNRLVLHMKCACEAAGGAGSLLVFARSLCWHRPGGSVGIGRAPASPLWKTIKHVSNTRITIVRCLSSSPANAKLQQWTYSSSIDPCKRHLNVISRVNNRGHLFSINMHALLLSYNPFRGS